MSPYITSDVFYLVENSLKNLGHLRMNSPWLLDDSHQRIKAAFDINLPGFREKNLVHDPLERRNKHKN